MRNLDKFRDCLIGGAAGDALGYEIEFMSGEEIFSRFGENGITKYTLHNDATLILDDSKGICTSGEHGDTRRTCLSASHAKKTEWTFVHSVLYWHILHNLIQCNAI